MEQNNEHLEIIISTNLISVCVDMDKKQITINDLAQMSIEGVKTFKVFQTISNFEHGKN